MTPYALWRLAARATGFLTKRTLGRDFDAMMWWGCDVAFSAPPGRGVSLTFDDGPHPEFTPRLLDELARLDLRATFFCVGRQAQMHPDIVRRAVAEGHEIANHTMNHPDLHLVSPARLRAEVSDCQAVLRDILGRDVPLFRAPYGRFRWDLRHPEAFGLQRLVRWDVGPDPLSRSSESYVQSVMGAVHDGSIVLLHDNLLGIEATHAREAVGAVISAVPAIASGVRGRGLAFATVSEQFAGAKLPS